MLIDFGFDIFASNWNWYTQRDITFFRNKNQLQRYQNIQLNRILRYHNKELNIPLNHRPNQVVLPSKKVVELYSSGTSSPLLDDRRYFYSLPQQSLMEDHHIWKIEKLYGITNPGKVLYFSHSSEPYVSNGLKNRFGQPAIDNGPFCSIFGPVRYWPVGSHNETYHFFYNVGERFTQHEWDLNIDRALKLNPKFVRCSPSILETIYRYAPVRFNCPIILSEETLTNRVREIANQMFPVVIDKMVCWDGGLSWFECPAGRKHVYDEFCYLEKINGKLVSTDLNNEAMAFIRYCNNDNGEIDQGLCDCGLYGNYFIQFYGKEIEAIYVDGEIVSGRFISEFLLCFLRGSLYINKMELTSNPFGNDKIIYRLHQKEDQSIEFSYLMDRDMTKEQEDTLIKVLNWILTSDEKKKLPISIKRTTASNMFHKEHRRSKSLEISSAFLKTHRG